MKNNHTLMSLAKRSALALLVLFCSLAGKAQTDTLHINYDQIKTIPHDTSLAKIDAWIKTLKGAHVDINVYAYYSKMEFKKYAQERADEMFLVLNRKARTQFTIVFIGPKKGENSQRSRVDIVYKRPLTAEEIAAQTAAAAKEKEEAAKKKEAEAAEKAAKESKEKEKKSTSGKTKGAAEAGAAGAAGAAVAVEGGKDKKEDDKKGKEGKDDKEKEKSDEEIDFGHVSTINNLSDGAEIELADLKYIKRAKLIISQTGKKDVDDNLFKAVTDYWTFSSNITAMPYNEAEKLRKTNKKDTLAIMSFAMLKIWHTMKSFGYEYRIFKLAYAVCIENGKGKIIYKQIIPIDKEKGTTLEYVAFGVSTINYFFNTMYDLNLENSKLLQDALVQNPKELKGKTLVISERMIHPKLPPEDISKYYGEKVEIVSHEQWIDVILQKKNKVYVMVTKYPRKTTGFFHYLVDAKTGKVLLLDKGPDFQMGMNIGYSKNMDPSQSGYVDKANFERYTEIINTVDERAAALKGKTDEKAAKEKEKADKKAAADAEKEAKKAEEKKKKEEEAAKKAENEALKKKEKEEKEDSKKK